jgi:hypothetical protein
MSLQGYVYITADTPIVAWDRPDPTIRIGDNLRLYLRDRSAAERLIAAIGEALLLLSDVDTPAVTP